MMRALRFTGWTLFAVWALGYVQGYRLGWKVPALMEGKS